VEIDLERYRVQPRASTSLADFDPAEAGGIGKKRRAAIEAERDADLARLRELQERLYAERKRSLLVVLLAADTGGKDSTIDHIFSGVNPQGCRVTSFGVPTAEEAAHDFLWRIHPHTPAKGQIGIFNRSHYEDVTAPRVSGAIDVAEWTRRYEHIRHFEQLLTDAGTHVVKFHLRISEDEQAARLLDRINDPVKHWKFNPHDLADRARWDDYQMAFEEALNATSTQHAPWYVVPANAKWLRDAIVARAVSATLENMDPRYPQPVANIEQYAAEIRE
jgi:PPK2 family polyphosphate:nucleotide phosphotransferase